jgi:hypothetical protein
MACGGNLDAISVFLLSSHQVEEMLYPTGIFEAFTPDAGLGDGRLAQLCTRRFWNAGPTVSVVKA